MSTLGIHTQQLFQRARPAAVCCTPITRCCTLLCTQWTLKRFTDTRSLNEIRIISHTYKGVRLRTRAIPECLHDDALYKSMFTFTYSRWCLLCTWECASRTLRSLTSVNVYQSLINRVNLSDQHYSKLEQSRHASRHDTDILLSVGGREGYHYGINANNS